VDEHVLAAVVAHDKAEALLRVEEFDDAFAFADDLRGHSATGAATKASASAAAAIATASATAAAEAAAIAKAPAAVSTTAAAAVAASFLKTTTLVGESVSTTEEIVALVPTASAAVTFAPSIETHACSNFRMPQQTKTNALGPRRNRSRRDSHSRTVHSLT
jgi:hypothetical protein